MKLEKAPKLEVEVEALHFATVAPHLLGSGKDVLGALESVALAVEHCLSDSVGGLGNVIDGGKDVVRALLVLGPSTVSDGIVEVSSSVVHLVSDGGNFVDAGLIIGGAVSYSIGDSHRGLGDISSSVGNILYACLGVRECVGVGGGRSTVGWVRRNNYWACFSEQSIWLTGAYERDNTRFWTYTLNSQTFLQLWSN